MKSDFSKEAVKSIFVLLLFLVLIFGWSTYSVNKLKKHATMVIGYTGETYYASKSRPYIKYKYVVNGKEYESARSIQQESIIRSSNQPILIIYSSTSPSGSAAILDANINGYNKEQLDSLFKNRVKSLNVWNVK